MAASYPLDLLKRSEKGSAINSTEHDANMTKIEDNLNDISSKNRKFVSVAAMVAATDLSIGDIVETVAYYSTQDGGGALYEIVTATGSPDGIFHIDLTGSGHEAKLLHDGSITATQAGVYTGSTATSTIFQTLVDNAPVGFTVYLPNGDYNFSTTGIELTKRVNITGLTGVDEVTPNESDCSGVRIKYTGTGYAFSIGTGSGNGVRGCKLKNFSLFGDDTGVGGIQINGTSGLSSSGNEIENVNINNFTTYGIHGVQYCWSNTLKSVGVHDCGKYLYLASDCNDWIIIDPDFSAASSLNTDTAMELGGGASDSIVINVIGGAIQNVQLGLKTNTNARVVNLYGTYFENCERSFNIQTNAVTLNNCSYSGRDSEDYIGIINAGNVSIIGGYTFGTINTADFFIAGGAGDIRLNAKASSAADMVKFDTGQPTGNWTIDDPTDIFNRYSDDDKHTLLTTGGAKLFKNTGGTTVLSVQNAGVTVGKDASTGDTVGAELGTSGYFRGIVDGGQPLIANRLTSDGTLCTFQRDTVTVGEITVASGVITYGTFCGSHISQMDNSESILPGTVLSATGGLIDRERYGDNFEYLTKVKISDTQNDKAVYGIFLATQESKVICASIGTAFIRMHKDAVVTVGDYVTSNGDGTAILQTDSILHNYTIAKIVSIDILKTYDDGSYLLACTLHCG